MARQQGFHEDFEQAEVVRAGSERSFGIVFAVVFTFIGLAPLMGDGDMRLWALYTGGGFLAAALTFPKMLAPLNQLWFRFGMLLHKIVNPLIMGLLFYLTVTPIALIMRMAGKDPLCRRLDPDADSYWIKRDPAGPAPETMRNQF